jgi:hypothetical protein
VGVCGLAAGALMACSAPNPNYHPADLDHRDAAAEDGPTGAWPSDAAAPNDRTLAADQGAAALLNLTAVDSLGIDLKGTIYFSSDDTMGAWIGRLPAGGVADRHWLAVAEGPPMRGLVIDTRSSTLYFTAGPPMATLQALDLRAASPSPRIIARDLVDPNDLAVGLDGKIYASDQGDGHVYSYTPDGKRTRVTRSPIGSTTNGTGPAALAFGPDRSLVVGVKGGQQLLRLFLSNGLETGRKPFGMVYDWVNGLAYDEGGRLYVGLYSQDVAKTLVRLDSDDAVPVMILANGRFSALVFGRGGLDPKSLFVAEPAGPVHMLVTDVPGLPTP